MQFSRPGTSCSLTSPDSGCRSRPSTRLSQSRPDSSTFGVLSPPTSPSVFQCHREDDEGDYLLEQLRRLASHAASSRAPSPLFSHDDSPARFDRPRSQASRRTIMTHQTEFCERANDHIDEFLQKWQPRAKPSRSKKVPGLGLADPEELPGAEIEARFHALLKGIDQAFTGGDLEETRNWPVATLRVGNVVEDTLEANSILYLVVPLPRRKVEVVVTVIRLSGSTVGIYGSDSNQRPTARNCEFEADGGELCYPYDPAQPRAALYICIESGEQGCCCRIRVSLRRFNADGSAFDASCNVGAIHRVAHKVSAIRDNNLARIEFQARLKDAKMHLSKKKVHLTNYLDVNQAAVHEIEAEGLAERHKRMAKQQMQKLESAAFRRDEVQKATEERIQSWIDRAELRRLGREEQLQKERNRQLCEERRSRFMLYMLTLSFGLRLFRTSKLVKAEREQIVRNTQASQRIQTWFFRFWCRNRRKKLYLNILKFRSSVMLVARQLKPLQRVSSQLRIKSFLQQSLEFKQNRSMPDVVRHFIAKVTRIQRAVRRIRRIREAYASALLMHFTAANMVSKVLSTMIKDILTNHDPKLLEGKADLESERMQPIVSAKLGRCNSLKPFKRRGAILLGEVHYHNEPNFVKAYNGRELLPAFIRSFVIRQHVQEMQSTFKSRCEDWSNRKQEFDVELEVLRMGLQESNSQLDGLKRGPQLVELSRLRALYEDTYDAWTNNEFRHIEFWRKTRLRQALSSWCLLKFVQKDEVPVDDGKVEEQSQPLNTFQRLISGESAVSSSPRSSRLSRGFLTEPTLKTKPNAYRRLSVVSNRGRTDGNTPRSLVEHG